MLCHKQDQFPRILNQLPIMTRNTGSFHCDTLLVCSLVVEKGWNHRGFTTIHPVVVEIFQSDDSLPQSPSFHHWADVFNIWALRLAQEHFDGRCWVWGECYSISFLPNPLDPPATSVLHGSAKTTGLPGVYVLIIKLWGALVIKSCFNVQFWFASVSNKGKRRSVQEQDGSLLTQKHLLHWFHSTTQNRTETRSLMC